MNVVLMMTLLAAVDLSRPGIGDAAPALELETLDGKPFAGLRGAGGPVVVDFFATWCKPCHGALGDLRGVKSAVGGKVRVVLVAVGEDAGTVRRFLAAHPVPEGAEIALDRGGGTAHRWGQETFPTTFLVDDAGVIRHINRGWGGGYQARITKWLREMLATPRRQVVKGVEILH